MTCDIQYFAGSNGKPTGRGEFFTPGGRKIYLLEPGRSEVHIEDIAIALSRQCRGAGNIREDIELYSVAQHSVVVSTITRSMAGLLHDATEAYLHDIMRPVKQLIGDEYIWLEKRWALHLGELFGIGTQLANLSENVLRADRIVLETEKRDIFPPNVDWSTGEQPLGDRIVAWNSKKARNLFLLRFAQLAQAEGLRGIGVRY